MTINRKFKELMRMALPEKADKLTIHSLRDSIAMMIVNRGVDPYTLTELMRHRNLNTTMKYYIHKQIDKMYDAVKHNKVVNATPSKKPHLRLIETGND